MGKTMRGMVALGLFSLISVGSVSAQSIANSRASVMETRNCEFSEIDDYKHAHFNQALHDRDNQRISIRRDMITPVANYHQQAGAPQETFSRNSFIRDKWVPIDDEVVQQRDYKRGQYSDI